MLKYHKTLLNSAAFSPFQTANPVKYKVITQAQRPDNTNHDLNKASHVFSSPELKADVSFY